MHIVIDGYNLIRQSDAFSLLDLQDIQFGREALIDALGEYKKVKGHRITVVFDGADAVGLGQNRDRVKGIEIRFSRGGETADAVIKRMAARDGQKLLVVSSDRDVAQVSASKGAATIESREFENRLAMAAPSQGFFDDVDKTTGWIPTTKKKGPSRRLSKKDRRRRLKISKL